MSKLVVSTFSSNKDIRFYVREAQTLRYRAFYNKDEDCITFDENMPVSVVMEVIDKVKRERRIIKC